MTYTQNATTGATGARPISELVRRFERRIDDLTRPAIQTLTRAMVLRALDGARQKLEMSEGELSTLRTVVLLTRDSDWTSESRPRAWPTNQHLASEAGKSVSTIKNRIRRCRELGLIAMHDSANGKRRGSRNRTSGAITEAFGFDLSPLRARYDELLQLAARHKVETDMLKTGQRRLSASYRVVSQVIAQAAEAELTGDHWIDLRAQLDACVQKAKEARRGHDVGAFEAAVDAADATRCLAIDLADRLIYGLEIDPKGSENDPHIYLQTNPSFMNVQAGGKRSRDDGAALIDRDRAAQVATSAPAQIRTSPKELRELFPAAAQYLSSPNPDWDDTYRAAVRLRHDLGIRGDTYVEAVSLLGREGAALAVFITAERDSRNEIRLSAGCYFAGMTEKARCGQLDLSKSLWGYRKAAAGA